MSTNPAEKMRAETERFLEKALGLVRNHRKAYQSLVRQTRWKTTPRWGSQRNAA
jgi:hypothetical protein